MINKHTTSNGTSHGTTTTPTQRKNAHSVTRCCVDYMCFGFCPLSAVACKYSTCSPLIAYLCCCGADSAGSLIVYLILMVASEGAIFPFDLTIAILVGVSFFGNWYLQCCYSDIAVFEKDGKRYTRKQIEQIDKETKLVTRCPCDKTPFGRYQWLLYNDEWNPITSPDSDSNESSD